MSKYIEALKQGREVVVCKNNSDFDASIFYMEEGKIYILSRFTGAVEATWLDIDKLDKHFKGMKYNGVSVIICGCAD